MEGASLALIYQKGILNNRTPHTSNPFQLNFSIPPGHISFFEKSLLPKTNVFWLKKSSVVQVLDLVTTEAKHFCGKNRWKAALQTVRYMNKTAESDAAFVWNVQSKGIPATSTNNRSDDNQKSRGGVLDHWTSNFGREGILIRYAIPMWVNIYLHYYCASAAAFKNKW